MSVWTSTATSRVRKYGFIKCQFIEKYENTDILKTMVEIEM